ncbi:hypothetical protein Ade02nite_00630 [Paractinoplanes deccanensis]|uniref:DUF4132 domain-containing protein n=1 Tax=Paractinoplanes deccanensis TaxID=113561 RepID=A0ABQ3XUU5_9ACTN|nr:DUF4132 domain-containing protein [Actinoplanes deccanensis]GID71422.1 hypothetical protein Ade02nite_00630 [Actinoplanes deccanensis]
MGRKAIAGLECADPTVMVWEDGERERWLARAGALDHGREQADWVRAVTGADRLSDLSPEQVAWLFAKGPEGSARALLGTPLLVRVRQRVDLGQVAVARFGLDALGLALRDAAESADRLGLLLLPFRGPEPAALVAGWLRHLGSARLWARLWLDRHAEAAARALIPAAVGRASKARQNAEDALRHLTATGHGELVLKTAEGYGAEALAAVGALLELPPTRELPTPTRRLPEPVRNPALGTPKDALPADEISPLIDALARSRLADPPEPPPGDPAPPGNPAPPGDPAPAGSGRPLAVESSAAAQPLVHPPDPEAAALFAAHEPARLARFGRELLDDWLADGMPAARAWVVLCQAHIGDDATMDKLGPLVRAWPAQSRWQRAVDGLAVLATAGTDVALRHLLAIEENMVGGPMNDRALVHLAQAAARRGLTVTELADRLAVTHGLDGGVTLDYGPRAFTVEVDDHLTLYAVDAAGRRLARPPKPGVRDTRPEGHQHFVRLKKDLRTTASSQIARLERDMLAHRPRPARHVRDVLLPHPILGPLARRLVWAEPGARTLRIAEDGTFADVDDTTAPVGDDAPLVIVHPAELTADELAGWSQIFADYEIVQPFPQINRPAVRLTGEQRAATGLPGFGPVSSEEILDQLRKDRWLGNSSSSANRLHTQLYRTLPDGHALVVEIDPGVTMFATNAPTQRITEIWLDDAASDHWQLARTTPLGAADPAALSEVLVELYRLAPHR